MRALLSLTRATRSAKSDDAGEPAPLKVVKASPTSRDVVATVRVTIGERMRAIPLYATDAALAVGDFTIGAKGISFAVPAGGSVRLTQFGNKPSSKQPQASHALSLSGESRLRVELEQDRGGYGPDCFLCIQLYDQKERFITQLWTPLTDGGEPIEFKLPDKAALGCFAIQVSGAALLRALRARLTWRGKGELSFKDRANGPDELRAMLQEARTQPEAAEALERTVLLRSGFIIASIATWYANGNYTDIVELLAVATELVGKGDISRLLAYLRYYVARGLSNLNATESALEVIADLKAMADWRTLVGDSRVQTLLLLEGQALVRSGRVADGLAALDVARLNDPEHWEAYFLLANNIEEDEVELRDSYYAKARALLGKPHAKLGVACIENDLRHGRLAAAKEQALAGIAASTGPHDLWLALANVNLAAGDEAGWRAGVQDYFKQFELTPPRFAPLPPGSSERYATLTTEPAPTDDQDRGLVAIIMTTFNSADTLPLAVESVLAQSYRRIKLIIVDDVSSDATVEVARSYAARDPRVEVMVQEVNGGTYAAKNAALAKIQADYYTFHDSDDWMHPERIVRHLDEMELSGAACTTSLWFRMEADGRAASRHAGGYQHTNPASIFIRRDVLETVGYFDSVRTGADTEFVWRIRHRYSRSDLREIKLPLAIGLYHEASLTQSGVTAFNRHRFSEVRLAYWESWVRWHLNTLASSRADLHVPFPLDERRFWAPPAIMPEGDATPAGESDSAIEAAGDEAVTS